MATLLGPSILLTGQVWQHISGSGRPVMTGVKDAPKSAGDQTHLQSGLTPAVALPTIKVPRTWDFQCKNQSQLQEHLLLPSAHGGTLGKKHGQKTPERRAGAGRPWEYCRGFSGRVPWHPWAPRFWRTNLCFAESVTSEANKPPDARALCAELEGGSRKQRTCP